MSSPACAWRRCPRPPGRPTAARSPSLSCAVAGRSTSRPARRRPSRPAGTGSPWGRRCRSCGPSAARRPARGSASRSARPGRSRRSARAASCRSRRWCWPAAARPRSQRNVSTCSTSAAGSPRISSTTTGTLYGSQPASCRPSTSLRATASIRSTASAAVRAGPSARAESLAGTAIWAPGSASSAFSSSPTRRVSARPKARHRSPVAGPGLLGAQHPEHEVDQRLALGSAAEDVQPVADLDVLDLAEVAVDVQHELVEVLLGGRLVDVQVVVQLGGRDQLPDLRPDRRQLDRVERRDAGVLVEQLLELGQLAVGVGPRHRRHQVVDDRRRAHGAWPACPRRGR